MHAMFTDKPNPNAFLDSNHNK